jgi:hypothetical protein
MVTVPTLEFNCAAAGITVRVSARVRNASIARVLIEPLILFSFAFVRIPYCDIQGMGVLYERQVTKVIESYSSIASPSNTLIIKKRWLWLEVCSVWE